MLSAPIAAAGRINGIAETLDVANPRANTKNDVLITIRTPCSTARFSSVA
jgi:hypothetical protein